MTTNPTPGRLVRIPTEDWDDLAEAAAAMDTDRSKLLNAFTRWYLRRPGAKLPTRPPAEQPAA